MELHPVEGKVTFKEDDQPLRAGRITFESTEQQVSATATINKDGTFRLGTTKKGDGAVLGRHRVVVVEQIPAFADQAPPPTIHRKHQSFDTSGLEFTVEPGRNYFEIQVERLHVK